VPDYDNSIYVVDLARWQYREEAGDEEPTFDLNDEWEPIEAEPEPEPELPVNQFPYPDGEDAAAHYLVEQFGVRITTARAAIIKAISDGTYKGRGYLITITDGAPDDVLAKTLTIDAK
jgi:hypothetical protein